MKLKTFILCLILTITTIINNTLVMASSSIDESDIGYSEKERNNSKNEYSKKDKFGNESIAIIDIDYNGSYIKELQYGKSINTIVNKNKIFCITKRLVNGKDVISFEFNFKLFSEKGNKEQIDLLYKFKNSDFYSELNINNKTMVIQTIMNNVKTSESVALQSIFGDIKPDLAKGYKVYIPFESTVNIVLGILVIVIGSFISLSFLIDLTYIVLPFTKEEIKPKVVSMSAQNLVIGISKGKGIFELFIIYIKERLITTIVLLILLMYIALGDIFKIMTSIMNLVE